MMRDRPWSPWSAIALAALLLPAWAADGQAYRYKDGSGNWVYTDRPPSAGQRADTVRLEAASTSPRILVEPRSGAGAVGMFAINECRCVVEFGVRITAADGRERAAKAVVPPLSQQLLIEVPAPPGTGTIEFDYGYVIGDPGAVHAPRVPYRAPFALVQSFTVSQAPPDTVTHRDPSSRNAVDIEMPVGTAVHAAREGLVINVAHRHFRGGLAAVNVDEANFVQILHDDGTTAIYAHLQMDSVRVRPGQQVQRGQYIANSGNTGFSSGPHLHFVVVRNAGLRAESVPLTFAGPGGARVVPRSRSELVAY
jgi:murein DD-endopeptidase MepM/ murein hydrolase activator NlpD